MSEFEVKRCSPPAGHRQPVPMLSFQVELRNASDKVFDVIGASFWLSRDKRLHLQTPEAPALCRPDRVYPGRVVYLTLQIPMSMATLRAIEDTRSGQPPGTIEIPLNLRYQRVRRVALPGPDGRPSEVEIPEGPSGEQIHLRTDINREHWLQALAAMGYEEFEVIELPVRRLRQHPPHAEAVGLLRRAQEQFRVGSWNECILNSRLAVEKLGHASSPEALKEKGPNFNHLWETIAPGEDGAPRRAALDRLSLALRDLRHPAAHVHLPGRDMERAEAELALSVALTVFRYVGERWSRPASAK